MKKNDVWKNIVKKNNKKFMMQKQKKENKEMKNVIKIIKYLWKVTKLWVFMSRSRQRNHL